MLSSREEMGIRHLASSANSKMFEEDSDVDRSFMKMTNKSGPRIYTALWDTRNDR